MSPDTILISAPYSVRSGTSSVTPWRDYLPFQPLLGFDAQMADFVERLSGVSACILCLAAPEIAPAAKILGRAGSCPNAAGSPVHVRFGPLRTCRLSKGSRNIGVLAENALAGPLNLGLHPFASGNVAPKGLSKALTYEQLHITPWRIDGTRLPVEELPGGIDAAAMFLQPMDDHDPPARGTKAWPADVTVRSSTGFAAKDWLRRPAPLAPAAAQKEEPMPPIPASPCVLLPWNLAHPGSLVPDLLEKTRFLAERAARPVTLLVFPYNDEPEGLTRFMQVADANRARERAASWQAPAMLFARAHTLRAGMSLARLCKRAWIDTTDPESGWTMLRLRRLGLPVNIVSSMAVRKPGEGRGSRFAADEEACVRPGGLSGQLVWRCRALSLRRLAALMAAVLRDEDEPLPAMAAWSAGTEAGRAAEAEALLGAISDA